VSVFALFGNICRVNGAICGDRRVSTDRMYVPLCASVRAITKDLSLFKVESLHGCHIGAEDFESHILMRDELRVHLCEPKSTWQSTERLHITYPTKMKCKGGYTRVTLPRIVTPYLYSVGGTRGRVTYQKLVTR
jgi:hypothetical protein